MRGAMLPEPDHAVVIRQPQIVNDLQKLIGADRVIADADGRRTFESDALATYRCMPLAVVLARSTNEIAQTLAYCHQHDIKVVPRGAGTSLSGGALPSEDAVVVSVARMHRVLELDFINRIARVEAGITNLAITEAVQADGFFYAPDPSSQLACTLAGNIAMNAGGAHCLKYGVTTNNVLGVKMVLIDGEIVEIGGAHLDAAGYDLLGLVIGSEGQFGIVTEATVRILPAAEEARSALLGFSSTEAASACVAAIIASGIVPVGIELVDQPAIHLCESFARAGYPMDVAALLIIEVEGSAQEIEQLLDRIAAIARAGAAAVVRLSQTPEQSAAIWKGRNSVVGAIGRTSDYYCVDGTVPPGRLSEALLEISHICARHALKVANIFRAGDGNLHTLILYNASDSAEAGRSVRAGAEILQMCVEFGGCLTGEHGVGIEKRELMRVQFSDADLALQMRIKSSFDRKWLLNAHKVFPLDSRTRLAAASRATA
jgi:glycolate oxidase